MLTTHSADSWFAAYCAANARQIDALVALRQSADIDKRTKGAPVRDDLARALRHSRMVDRLGHARWAGMRVMRVQYDRTRPGYTPGRF
jgi:hypothetical protein